VLANQLAAARRIIAEVEASPPVDALLDPPLTDDFERIRWFTLPSEGLALTGASSARGGSGRPGHRERPRLPG
jgi:hypothetical protein